MRTHCSLLIILIRLSVSISIAQTPTAILTGRVIDARTGENLPFASVYLNNSSRGTTADSNGVYRLTNVPLGDQELVGSALGYQVGRQSLRLTDAHRRTIDLRLEPTDQALATVTVKARHTKDWIRQFRTFNRELFGNRPQARQCRIMNPSILLFEEEKGHLRAQAAEPLVIDNGALGYRLYYNLLHFDFYQNKLLFAGTVRFEELKPTDAHQQTQWQANRQNVYQKSLQHVLASLLAGTHEQAGYVVYRTPLIGNSNDQALPLVSKGDRQYIGRQQAQALFKPGELPFEHRLISDQPLEVYDSRIYANNSPYGDRPYAYSLLLLPKGSASLTTTGSIMHGQGLDVRGYLGSDRLATLLPSDWIPANQETVTPTVVTAGKPGRLDAGLDSLVALHRRQDEQAPPLVYVQTDKAYYCTGDRLWLSAYMLDAARQLPLAGRTAALQVELIAPTGQSVQHQWLRLTDGRATASFRLADTLRTGTYRLRAYTAVDQPESGPGFECSFVLKNLIQTNFISSAETTPTVPTGTSTTDLPRSDSLDVQFLPEGGRWLAGVSGRLGIKAVQPDGRGRLVSGRIVDQSGAEVARFKTNHLGMGQVALTPKADQRYRAVLEPSLMNRPVDLPVAESEGWALAADAVSDSSLLSVIVRARGQYSQQPVYVTLVCREQLVYRQKWLLANGEAQFSLSTATLPPGLCRLTLWDMNRQSRAERLMYITDQTGGAPMRVTMGKPRYEPRELVAIGLQFRSPDGSPVAALWSAAVTDADQLPEDTNRPDLRTHLLLTGGLRGPIESPAYYMESDHAKDLDNLLLTQGWRRLPASERADSTGGWTLCGRVHDERGRPLADKVVLLLLEQGGQKMLRSATTDAKGRFRADGLLQADTVQVQARVLQPGPDGAVLTFDKPGQTFLTPVAVATQRSTAHPTIGSEQTPASWLASARLRQADWPAFYRDSTARLLQEVVVKAMKLAPERPKEVEQSSLHGAADGVLVVTENLAASVKNALELTGRVPGAQSRGPSSFGDSSPLYLLDGVYVDRFVLRELPPNEISRIELLKNPANAGIYGSRGANGIFAFYTRKGNEADLTKFTPSSVKMTVYGFASPRQFYVPRYELSEVGSHTDRRDVLYWQPLGQSGPDGLATLNFPLSDTARRLRVVVQGLTTDGLPISFTWILPAR